MIPKYMKEFLWSNLPETAIENRLIKKKNGKCFLEFDHSDEHLLSHIGVIIDKLGPKLVVCMWDEESPLEIGGYLIVDNLSMGSPSMGGIRMLPNLVPSDIYNLARGMTLKNAAAHLPYGGGKAGIVADNNKLTDSEHDEIVKGFAHLIRNYQDIYVPGPDVGTNDSDMRIIAIENGLDSAVSKPLDLGGNRIDELGAAAGGVIIALHNLLKIMPRLRVLPQFSNLEIPNIEDLTVLIQGFGAVGAHACRILKERMPNGKVIGVSDIEGYLYNENGLPIEELFHLWKDQGLVTKQFFKDNLIDKGYKSPTKYSTKANDLLREDAFCFIPAAPVFNYLSVRPEKASMTVQHMGNWSLIVEGANTYSPDPNRKAARKRMEQVVFRENGVMVANDYLVNSGGVIFAAQEHLIKTPEELQIPKEMLGKENAVEKWLKDHAEQFSKLSKKRLESGRTDREEVIRHNMIELIDLLTSNQELLPSDAAERISLKRLAESERERRAEDIMIEIPKINLQGSIRDAASMIIRSPSNMVAILSEEEQLVGVVTAWDITKSIAKGKEIRDIKLEEIMTKDVVVAEPDYDLLLIISQLEQHQISAMPVVDNGKVLGLVSSDLIAQRYVARLMQDQELLRL